MWTYGGVRRGAMWGFGGVASDNRQDSNHQRLGASAEGLRAWLRAPSPSSHLCRPPRPHKPRVAIRPAPVALSRPGHPVACVILTPMAKRPVKYWLMKSEPDTYSIDDLQRDQREPWEGVRNYQARNFMREMVEGDLAIFYHSNAKPPGAAGVARVCREAYPDDTQFLKKSKYYDAKSKKEDSGQA